MSTDDTAFLEDPFPAVDTPAVPDVAGLVRAVRRRADLSQRQLAELTGLARSTIGRIESRTLAPSLETLGAILAVAGLRLVTVTADNELVTPMADPPTDDLRDGAGRRYPSHLDTIIDPGPGEWWADRYGLARPPETFHRDRALRDAMRRRSVWEVRVQQLWSVEPPPTVERWIQLTSRCDHCGTIPDPVPPPFTPSRVHRYLTAAARLASAQVAAVAPVRQAHGAAPGPSAGL
ncbi:helix-turn-helix transcriptional regulator [Pseudonocardia nematodicida]|uniref:Helix-turn-helix transcriptional regulator n=1 Tax=Pseudonocardia nematodicida TaxID=1206997 RepID=A0ABV1KAR0_9PSEU